MSLLLPLESTVNVRLRFSRRNIDAVMRGCAGMDCEQSTAIEWLLVGAWILVVLALFYALAIDDLLLFFGLTGATSLLLILSYVLVFRRAAQQSPV